MEKLLKNKWLMLLVGAVVLYFVWRKFGNGSKAGTGNGTTEPTTKPPEPTAVTHGSPVANPFYTRAYLEQLKNEHPEYYQQCYAFTLIAFFTADMKGELTAPDAYIVDCMRNKVKHGDFVPSSLATQDRAGASGFFGNRDAWHTCWCGGWNFQTCQHNVPCSQCCSDTTITRL
jgi:hypothetical protein